MRTRIITCVLTTTLAAWGNIIRVPQDIATIQGGLDAASDGDTILVGMGVYAEALTAPPLHFTLKGDVLQDTGDYPRPVIDPSSLLGSDSLGCLYLPAGSWPVLEDLTFRNGPEMYPRWNHAIGGINSRSNTVTMRRCVMDSTYCAFYHFRPNGENIVDSLVECVVRDVQAMGIAQLDYPVAAYDCDFVSGRAQSLCLGGHGSRIINCHFGPNPIGSSLVLVENGSEVSNCVFGPSFGPSLVWLTLGQDTADVVVRNNVFADIAVGNCVIDAQAYAPQAFLIEDNTFLNIFAAADSGTCIRAGPYLPPFSQYGGTIRNNIFQNCFGRALGANIAETNGNNNWSGNRFVETNVDAGGLPAFYITQGSGSILRDNLFVNTGFALLSTASWVNAVWNWWSDSTGPFHATQNPGGQGDTIVGNVDFDPWFPDSSWLTVPRNVKPVPTKLILEAYPDPFNSSIRIILVGFTGSDFEITLHNLLGEQVAVIRHGPMTDGELTYTAPPSMASGVYFMRASNRRSVQTKKVILMK